MLYQTKRGIVEFYRKWEGLPGFEDLYSEGNLILKWKKSVCFSHANNREQNCQVNFTLETQIIESNQLNLEKIATS